MNQPQQYYPAQQPYPAQQYPPAQQPYQAQPAYPAQQSHPAQQSYQAQPAYPPQPHPAAQPQYQQQVAPQQGYAVPVQCRFCGCVPAAETKFRGHQGMILIMRFLSLDGPFCRDCGLSTFRRMTSRTLVQGWWGYFSFVITPITVLINVIRRGKVASLPAPQPAPNGQSRQPMDPGPPLLARPMTIIGLAIPFALFMLFVVAIVVSANSA